MELELTRKNSYVFAGDEVVGRVVKYAESIKGQPFNLRSVTDKIVRELLTDDQYNARVEYQRKDGSGPVVYSFGESTVNLAKVRISHYKLLSRADKLGFWRSLSDAEITEEIDEIEDEETASDDEGFVYAYTFPALLDKKFVKIGQTGKGDPMDRIRDQCRGAAMFEAPTLLNCWPTKNRKALERAIGATLKFRGKHKADAPGAEWFITTAEEIDAIVNFVNAQ